VRYGYSLSREMGIHPQPPRSYYFRPNVSYNNFGVSESGLLKHSVALAEISFRSKTQIHSLKYGRRSINTLQNGVILLIFKIRKIQL